MVKAVPVTARKSAMGMTNGLKSGASACPFIISKIRRNIPAMAKGIIMTKVKYEVFLISSRV